MKKKRKTPKKTVDWNFHSGWFFLILVFGLTLVPLLFGFTRFPKFLGDEGIYVSQAWWLVYFHKLGPYTYWYDHFPLGWFLIGLWQRLTGGPFAFGLSVISGRVFMVLLAGASNVFLFRLIYRLIKSNLIAFFGALLFLLSPLSVLFHRQVLLDNIASFWLIIALEAFFTDPKKGKQVFISSIFLSLAVLSKESVIFIVPAFLLAVALFGGKKNRWYLVLVSAVTTMFLLSLFPLLALLKGEFLPGSGHVSFLETVWQQAGRGSQIPFWMSESDFYKKLIVWLKIDPFLILVGFGSLVLNMLFKLKDKIYLSFNLLSLFFILFLIRGGLVLDFYIIPLLPLLIIEICLLFHILGKEILLSKRIKRGFGVVMGIVLAIFLLIHGEMLYKIDATANQVKAIKRLQQIENKETAIIADNFGFLDLRLNKKYEPEFKNIEWYSKAEFDPQIKEEKLENDPTKIDVMLVNSAMAFELETNQLPFLEKGMDELSLIEKFGPKLDQKDLKLLKDLPYVVEELELYKKLDKDENNEDGNGQSSLEEMSFEQKIGQMLMISPAGVELAAEEKEWLESGTIGGFFLLEKNIQTKEQLEKLVGEISLKNTGGLKPFVAIDQEGGVARIPWIENTPQTAITTEVEAFRAALTRSEELSKLGITMNFAPVLDQAWTASSFIAKQNRHFAKDSGKMGAAMIKGYLEAGIIPVAKHFPGGLGRTSIDPHQDLPSINISQTQLEQDFEPFAQAIEAKVPAIMVTHILYPNIDKKPTSSSKVFMIDILRNRLGFDGVIIIDDFSMRAVKNNYDVGKYALESILAGADMLLVSEQEDYQEIAEGLNDAIESGGLSEEKLNESIIRIGRIKE